MAFIFYKESTDKERMRTLSYPYRPFLEDYFSPKYVQTDFATYLNCYKWFSKSGKYFDWKLQDLCWWRRAKIYTSTRTDIEILNNDQNFNSTANTLFNLLCEFGCSDMSMISLIIMPMYFLSKIASNALLPWNSEGKNMDDSGLIIPAAIHDADVKFLRILLRYGFQNSPSPIQYGYAMDTVRNLGMCIEDVYHEHQPNREIFRNIRKYVDIMSEEKRVARRKFDIIQALDAVTRKRLQCPTLPLYIQCIRMYFESTPEPFITRIEVKELIRIFLKDVPNVPDVERIVEELSEDFIQLFPETSSAEFYNPRKLQHLCRCKVRDILAPCGPLPDFVFYLAEKRRIPNSMIEYILCEFP